MYALRSKGTFSLVFNGHSNLFHERFERSPLHLSPCCACCSCTSLYAYGVPTHPNLLYGLRQSKLLQWSVYGVEAYLSRLPAYGMERYLPRRLVYGANHGCCEVHSYSRERSACNGSARRRHKCVSYCCSRVSDMGSEVDYGIGMDDADDVLSLLSEGMSEGCDGVRRRYGSSYERQEAEMGRNGGGRKIKVSSGAKVQEQREGDIVSELNEVKRKLAELESDLMRHQTVRRTARREKDVEGNNLAKRENHKAGDVSSRLSNCSVSSLGDFSSDAEIEDKYAQIEEELSIEHEKDRRRDDRVMGKVIEEPTRLRDYSKRLGESSDQKNSTIQGDVSSYSRKYRGNKIASTQEMQSRAGSSLKNMEVLRTHEIAAQNFSISGKKFNSQENDSSVSMNLDDRRGRHYSVNEVSGASVLPRFKTTEAPRSLDGYVNMSSRLKETYHGREEDVKTSTISMQETSDYLKRRVSKEDDFYVHSAKVISEVEDMNKTSYVSKQQDIRRMKLGESQISVQGTDEQFHQTGELIATCRNDKSTSELLEPSQIRENHIQHTNATKMNITNQKIENKINLVSGSSSEEKEMHFGITERTPHRVQSFTESKVVNNMSQLQGTGAELVAFWRNSDEGSMSQDTNSTSSFKSFIEMKDSKCQTDENITNFGAQHAAQPTKVSSSGKIAFEEVSGLQESLHSSTEVRMKQRQREESDRRSIQEMVMRPSLMTSRASTPAEPTTRIRSSYVCSETSEGSSSALSMHSGRTTAFQSEIDSGDESGRTYHEPLNTTTPEDSLGSTNRLEKFSSQYIGEFVETVGSEMQSAIEAGSCGVSGTMKPSDLMRDVRKPSVHSSQRLARGSAQGVPTTIMTSLEGTTGTSESSSSAVCLHSGSTTAFQSGTSGGGESRQTYHEPFCTANSEDSLGSADHLAKLSSQFIGEFVEKVRCEDMISETQRETKGSQFPLAVEVDKLREPSNTINPEDSLGSADGLEKLSSQFVGEFVDKVRHEVTISETQREIEGSELQSAVEVGTYWKNSSSQHVSQEGIQFELASSLSSGDSGAEGLSVLMEDVRETTVSSSQKPARGSSQSVPTTIIPSREVSGDTSESSCSALVRHSGRTTALQPETHSADESSQTFLEPLNTINSDALGSNDRLEKSSSQFIDEFLDKARREVMIPRTQVETKGYELQSSEIDKSRENSKNQYDIQEGSQSELASSHSSGFSGLKGPSDVMWDVREPSVQEISKAEEPMVTSPNEKAVVRRSGRVFWSIIMDVFRLRWGSHADDPNLTGRSGERSSLDKSASTEASSSGNEHNIKDSVRCEKALPPGSSTSDQMQLRKRFSLSEGKVFKTVGSKELKPPGKVTLSPFEKGKSSDSFSTDKEIMELSSPLQMSPVVEETKVIGSSELSKLKSVEHTGQAITPPETELPGAREKEVELKRRKLQRTKQVARDRFDDWEEAYKLDREQKIIDEMFMREALVEAKKAADAWEVPVGAVLVQHGKIISRGCNLVEELRDSTAHAEMICIREASNLLRSWRLSETTLYVTLEPCPMCAGAILQARIDAVVWGAPNKLLGADGSWVRLFPDEGDGSESRDKPAAPTHPFHPKMKIRRGVLASECADVMQQFFQLRRKKKKTEPSLPESSLPGSHNQAKLVTKMHDIFHFMFCL